MTDDPARYGRTKVVTIKRDFDALRRAIMDPPYDPIAVQDAWAKCERWLDFTMGNAAGSKQG